ncbi:fibrillin-3 isoform X2 [Peromyscus californicus insignis]|uniref:fibrillin-3 isoform X2 n=1 Tax=Peromyscus californicus insignis TaxID=564181 RepID=UPI0022A66B20|nr:fibrillin-3 isoform X2 [Peromyscus californicus insignis]
MTLEGPCWARRGSGDFLTACGPPARILLALVVLLCMENGQGHWDETLESASPGHVRRRGRPAIVLQGPNVCGSRFHAYCCPGWRTLPGRNQCIVPVCRHTCGNGFCFQPNLCTCMDGTLAPSCGVNRASLGCSMSCMNGGSCHGESCLCQKGYTGAVCGQPICVHGCRNGGRCIGPNLCACVYGFMGPQCERDFQMGPCFPQVRPEGCQRQLTGLMCTKALCCATVGHAWGLPCQLCPAQPHPCRRGLILNVHTGACQDVDECQVISGLCLGGSCLNTVGSFECHCPAGHQLNIRGTECEDRRVGTCFSVLIGGQCAADLTGHYTYGQCCCDKGRCWAPGPSPKLCPPRGSGEFLRLCAQGLPLLPAYADLFPGLSEVGFNNLGPALRPAQHNPHGSRGHVVPTLISGNSNNDVRLGLCFLRWGEEDCGIPLPGKYQMDVCCCSIGTSWGAECKVCPEPSSPEFSSLCPQGLGFASQDFLSGRPFYKDVNECKVFPGLCTHGTCRNSMGSFHCSCDKGFTLDAQERNCTDIDECRISPDLCGQGTCVNTPGSFECDCFPGFTSGSLLMKNCMDVDECARDLLLCQGGTCINTEGSYECHCPSGRELKAQGTACEDIDECTMSESLCPHGQCINVIGAFRCSCHTGFQSTPDGQGCVDVDECEDNLGICGEGQCTNMPGSYHCICYDGFSASPDMKICVDLNECDMNPYLCLHGNCENTKGSFTCHCHLGYIIREGATGCSDVDECEFRRHGCDRHASCLNIPGSFSCRCHPGWGGDGFKCHDLDECAIQQHRCDPNANCLNTVGSYHCTCQPGFVGDGLFCEDKDECMENVGLCENGQCLNVPGGYHCECDMGFSLTKNQLACWDVDECENPANCINGLCVNTPGSYLCNCPQDFQLNPSGVGCVDTLAGICFLEVQDRGDSDISCSEEIGAGVSRASCCCSLGQAWGRPCKPCPIGNTSEYRTLCPGGKGFRPNPITVIMEDINECQELPRLCQGGNCTNTFGTFQCECPLGYSLSEDTCTCEDIDECTTLVGQVCQLGQCLNTAGSFHCLCQDGFELTADRKDCMDINECLSLPGTCLPGTCQNSEGSFQCTCPTGFQVQSGHCIDTDECLEEPSLCFLGTCTNSPGTFQCLCPPGFVLSDSGHYCFDTRQSFCFTQFEAGKCSVPKAFNTTKTQCCCSKNPTKGWGDPCELCPQSDSVTFRELCPFGHGADPGPDDSRKDVDECAENPGICTGGLCVNTDGSFHCECPLGYSLDFSSITCVDIDECTLNPLLCAFRCHNTEGSYLCTCPAGYALRKDGTMCQDVDECADGSQDCHTRGMLCKNLIGTYICICLPGMQPQPSGEDCTDEDECQAQSSLCAHGRCINTVGSFQCDCDEGFHPSSTLTECHDIRRGLCFSEVLQAMCQSWSSSGEAVPRAMCCCGGGRGWGPHCELCPLPGTSAHRKLCPHGKGYSTEGQDVDECHMFADLCPHGECINSIGSFHCDCQAGYTPDATATACMDVDECSQDPRPCSFLCKNTEGTFLCACPRGYLLEEDLRTCKDLDECTSRQHNCQFICVNTVGAFACRCPPGFTQHQQACFDNDECLAQPGLCGTHGHCQNTPGSFYCECNRGFILDSSGHSCEDVNECDRPHRCQFGCQNELGGYRCSCPQGFTQHSQWAQCVDENECALSPTACGSASCYNTLGSFHCVCPSGFNFNQDLGGCQDVDECAEQGNPCSYGCANTHGGFLCGCPQGYFRAGQGHCISSPGFSSGSQATPDEEESLSPEACYECKINGLSPQDRPRRSIQGGHQVSLATLDTEVPLTLSLYISHLGQVKHILEFRPALESLGGQIRYVIARGNNQGFFCMNHLDGFSSLHLGHRRPRRGKYQLEVVSVAGAQGQPGPAKQALRLTVQLQLL